MIAIARLPHLLKFQSTHDEPFRLVEYEEGRKIFDRDLAIINEWVSLSEKIIAHPPPSEHFGSPERPLHHLLHPAANVLVVTMGEKYRGLIPNAIIEMRGLLRVTIANIHTAMRALSDDEKAVVHTNAPILNIIKRDLDYLELAFFEAAQAGVIGLFSVPLENHHGCGAREER